MSSKKIFVFTLLMAIMVGFLCYFGNVYADEYGLDTVAEGAGLKNDVTLPAMVGGILGTALSFIGVLFFALMVFGGFLWMTARGNEEQTKKALGTITSAVVGLVIVLSSYAITSFIFKNAQIADISEPVASTAPAAGTTVAEKDKACAAAKTGWTCNSIDMCAGSIVSSTDSSKVRCENSGKNNCRVNGDDGETPLCKKVGDKDQVCCQAKPASAVPDTWCFDTKAAKCEKMNDVGPANCTAEKGKVALDDSMTEKDCYIKSIVNNFDCSSSGSKGNCATSFTGLVCINDECIEQPTAEKSGSCLSTDNCKTGVCKDSICKYLSPCAVNRQNTPSTQTCTAVSCGEQNACTSDAQCGSDNSGKKGGGHCVNGKCESGLPGASCKSDDHCSAGNYCTSEGTPSCCLPKLDNGQKCYGMDNACKSKSCIEKSGFDVCE